MIGWSNNPALDAERYDEELERHQSMFPVCAECGRSLMNVDTIVRINYEYYCDDCVTIMSNEEMREREGIDG